MLRNPAEPIQGVFEFPCEFCYRRMNMCTIRDPYKYYRQDRDDREIIQFFRTTPGNLYGTPLACNRYRIRQSPARRRPPAHLSPPGDGSLELFRWSTMELRELSPVTRGGASSFGRDFVRMEIL